MTYEEALKILQTEKECVSRNNGTSCDRDCGKCDLLLPAEDILKAYELAILSAEKQIPKKPDITRKNFICPTCKVLLLGDSPFCKYCGQALKWGENDEM